MFSNIKDRIRLLFRKDRESYLRFYKMLGFYPKDISIYEQALLHKSLSVKSEKGRLLNNERLEFLGDAVLEVVSSEFLYKTFPRLPEGEMTKKRASLVCEPALAFCAREIDLGSFLLLGKGEEATGGRHRDSIVSDAMEATIGAIFLDGGFEPAKTFVLNYILNDIEHKQLFYDSKTILQELLQKDYKKYLAEIIIDGYTDTDGDYDYNLELSQKRSLAVAQYLTEIRENFLSSDEISELQNYLTVNGHGSANPVLDSDGNVDKDASRRVEVKFRLKDDEMINELNQIMNTDKTSDSEKSGSN